MSRRPRHQREISTLCLTEAKQSDAQLVRRDLAIAVRVYEAELAVQGIVAPALFDGVLHLPRHGQVRLVERVPVVEAVRDDRRREAAVALDRAAAADAARALALEKLAASVPYYDAIQAAVQGSTRERNSQLQRLRSRPFSTRFG